MPAPGAFQRRPGHPHGRGCAKNEAVYGRRQTARDGANAGARAAIIGPTVCEHAFVVRLDKPVWRWGYESPASRGVATHDGPESCAGVREGAGEALAGVRAGWVIEPRHQWHRGADAVTKGGRQHCRQRYRELSAGPARSREPGHVRNLHAREQGGPMVARRVDRRPGRTGNAEAARP